MCFPVGRDFRDNLRMYNNIFSFCSLGVEIDESVWGPKEIYTFRIKGVFSHRIGSLLPVEREQPKFAQIYITDTDPNRHIHHRLQCAHGHVEERIVRDLQTMVYQHNPYYPIYKTAKERVGQDVNLQLNLITFDAEKRDPVGTAFLLPLKSVLSSKSIFPMSTLRETSSLNVGVVSSNVSPSYILHTFPSVFLSFIPMGSLAGTPNAAMKKSAKR
jgi:hypothetical protein